MNNLKLLRIQKGMSQQKLADAMNVSQQAIYKYENDICQPNLQMLKELSSFFDTSIDYIVGDTENPRRIDFMAENDLTQTELHHMQLYRRLEPSRKALIDLLLEDYNK